MPAAWKQLSTPYPRPAAWTPGLQYKAPNLFDIFLSSQGTYRTSLTPKQSELKLQ